MLEIKQPKFSYFDDVFIKPAYLKFMREFCFK